MKYTQEGSITFSASILKQTATHVTLKFEISDTGIGIKPENLENLFETFQRFDQKIHYGIEGSGLGLAISNGYINLMGGEIKVDSTYQKGSTFTVLLEQKIVDEKPLEQDYSQNAIVQNTTSISNMKLYGTSVLVADDNAINLRVAHGILSYYGLVVDTASSGMEALKLCQSKKYDFVFMDQMMPEMDGIEAMREVRKLNSHYAKGGPGKIIVLTAERKVRYEQMAAQDEKQLTIYRLKLTDVKAAKLPLASKEDDSEYMDENKDPEEELTETPEYPSNLDPVLREALHIVKDMVDMP